MGEKQPVNEPIGVLIAARGALFRRGLAEVLEQAGGLSVVASVGTAEEAYRSADELLPAVALVGVALPDAPELDLAAELRRRFPALAIAIVTDAGSDEGLFAAILAGAAAYLDQDAPETELVVTTQRVAAGEYPINEQLLARPTVAVRVLERFRASAGELVPVAAFAPLTERELQILRLISNGKSNAAIGEALGISQQTVKNHVTSILRKLAVNDRTQAVVLALRRGLISAGG